MIGKILKNGIEPSTRACNGVSGEALSEVVIKPPFAVDGSVPVDGIGCTPREVDDTVRSIRSVYVRALKQVNDRVPDEAEYSTPWNDNFLEAGGADDGA